MTSHFKKSGLSNLM